MDLIIKNKKVQYLKYECLISLSPIPGRLEENGFEVAPGERGGDRGRRGRGRGEQYRKGHLQSLLNSLLFS